MAVSRSLRFKILMRDRFTCRYCGRSAPAVVLQVDHVHPVSRGGTDDPKNLVAACIECNVSKSGKLLPPASPPVGLIMSQTLPHVDACSACGGGEFYAAIREEPRAAGYVAFYRCRVGHQWKTYWANRYRLTPAEVAYHATELARG